MRILTRKPRLSVFVALLASSIPWAPANAQVLAGRVLDGATDAPLPDARVQALTPGGSDVGEPVLSRADGSFALELPDTGVYYVRVDRLSYGTVVDGEFAFSGSSGRLTIDVYLLPTPVELEGVTVRAEQAAVRRSLRRQGFYERVAAGFGDFIGPEEIENRMVGNVTDYLRAIPQLRYQGGVLRIAGNQPGLCIANVYIDGVQVVSARRALTLPEEALRIDNWVQPDMVSGIEVYRRISSTPLQWIEPNASCGTVVIWTRTGR